MPLHYDRRSFKTFSGLVAAILADHPTWTRDRARRYAGNLRARQEGLGRYAKKDR
jgi:hypothetical protein